ncbi:Uncharacterised protein [Vibrio cholerae]|nr:Uncharacterised protein [Vibrio cholerae]
MTISGLPQRTASTKSSKVWNIKASAPICLQIASLSRP